MDTPFLRILFGAVVLAIAIALLVGVIHFSGTQADTAFETNPQIPQILSLDMGVSAEVAP